MKIGVKREREFIKLINEFGFDWRFDRFFFIVVIIFIIIFYNNSFCNFCYIYFYFVFNVIEEILCFWWEFIDYGGVCVMGFVNF